MMTAPKLEWTVMVYLAADNDLASDAELNLLQMLKVGSTDRIHLLAQIDRFDQETPATRYVYNQVGAWTPEELPPQNTGSVEPFLEFIRWGAERHRAKRYLIVIWGHANGIDDDENDQSELSPIPIPAVATIGITGIVPNGSSTNLPTTLASIGFNNHPGDSLTSQELKDALEGARSILGNHAQIVIGMDACMMGMIEIARQISGSVDIMVASEQTIPDQSWPYDTILDKLVKSYPPLEPHQLAATIVEDYVAHYQTKGTQVTLSAYDLSKTEPFTNLIWEFVMLLTQLVARKRLVRAVSDARRQAQTFFMRDYVDLYDFCRLLQTTLREERFLTESQGPAADLCAQVQAICDRIMIAIEDTSGFVIASRTTTNSSGEAGPLAHAHGVSIYFPLLPTLYSRLEFSKQTHWDTFLSQYANVVFQPHEITLGAAAGATSNPVNDGVLV